MVTQMDSGKLARAIAKTNVYLLVVFAMLGTTFLMTVNARAQSDSGRVTGTVTDRTGALLPRRGCDPHEYGYRRRPDGDHGQ